MTDETTQTEVLVVGAGPVGLALAGDLGWRGRQCLLLERTDGAIYQPKMDLVGIRTMEFCRRWGITSWVEASPYNRDYPQDNVYLTALNGFEIGRQPMPSMNEDQPPPESPAKRERCPQNMFDPILQRFAEQQQGTTIWYEHELLDFSETPDGVVARVRDLRADRIRTVQASYLVGCDGGRSQVRETLGIGMQGQGVLTHTTNVIFECKDFNALHDKQPGYRYMFVGPKGTWATIVAINGSDQWRMSIIGDKGQRPQYTEDELKDLACQALGRPFEMKILSVLRWTRSELVADSYGRGRVFIAGDACHLTSPTGGLGMNTGIGDAVDLSWKLAAQLEGWGGPGLLASYTVERRPVAQRITRFSTGNLAIMKGVPTSEAIAYDSEAGQQARQAAGQALLQGLRREWFSLNMHLGNRYVGSPVCEYTETEAPEALQAEFDEAIHYRPSVRPGVRAPHAWLAPGQSTLDLYGRGFVLVLSQGADPAVAAKLAAAAQGRGMAVQAHALQDAAARALYNRAYVLVRPDGHVAWSGDAPPAQPDALWARVSGHADAHPAPQA